MSDSTIQENLKRGTIVMLILSLLKESDMYGYQLTQELSQRSNGQYVFNESSMYPTLYRMTSQGLISDEKRRHGTRRYRVYYTIEDKGIQHLELMKKEFFSSYNSVIKILESAEELN